MNKIIFLIIILLGFTAFYSCEKETEKPTLSVSTEDILLSNSGLDNTDAAAVFEVTSSASWKLRYYSWLTPSVTSGESGTSRVSVTATATSGERIGFITVVSDKDSEVSAYITIRQVPEELVPSTLTVSSATFEVNADGITEEGASPTVTISTNKDWAIADLPDWITATPASGHAGTNTAITLTVSSNEGDERVDSLTIVAGSRSETVTLKQLPILTVASKLIEVDFEGKSEAGAAPTVSFSSTKDWTIADLPDWVTANPTSGSAGTNIRITLTVETNDQRERNGSFTIQAGTRTETVAIKQLAEEQHLTVMPTIIQVNSAGNTDAGVSPTVTISTNKNWTITDLPDWVSASLESGNAGTDMAITLTVSNTSEERTGSFTVNAGYLSETVTIYQQGNDAMKTIPFSIVPNLVTITDHGDYSEFSTQPDASGTYILIWPNDNCRDGIVAGTLSFEYQIVDDMSNLVHFQTTGWAWIFPNQYFVLTGNGTGVDPNREELWTSFSFDLMPAVNAGWGEYSDASKPQIYVELNRPGLRLLIRNMKIVVELEP